MRHSAAGPSTTPRRGPDVVAAGATPAVFWCSIAAEDDADDEADAAKAEKAKSLVIKIDQVRAISDFVTLTTHRAGYRVLLIHPAEAMHGGEKLFRLRLRVCHRCQRDAHQPDGIEPSPL